MGVVVSQQAGGAWAGEEQGGPACRGEEGLGSTCEGVVRAVGTWLLFYFGVSEELERDSYGVESGPQL